MKKFTYGMDNAGNDRRLGKLWTASRYNYDPSDPWGETYKISETYVYADAAGRKTHRRTNITKGIGTDETGWVSYREIMTDMVYNDLNLPQIVQYPYCVDCGAPPPGPGRQQGYSYTGGRLASVPGFLNAVSYWPNGMWNVMTRSNSMTDTQMLDSSGMARPASISAGLSDACTAPAITSDPVGGTVTPSSSVTLSVSVSGSGPFTYEWRSSSGPVGTGPTFTATVSNTSTTTSYWVAVTNACKTIQSVSATVSVNECLAPGGSATFEPNANGTYTLVAVGTGTEPRSYTWRRASDQVVVGTGRKAIVGPLSATTTYTVTIANSCAGSPATLSVTVTRSLPMAAVLTALRTPNANQIGVNWTGPATGVAYTLQRRSGAAGWADLIVLNAAALAARAYLDDTVAGGQTYAYRLRTSAHPNHGSAFSNADVATTATFTPVVAGTPVTASSFASMLAAVNSVRAAVGWPAVTWANILSSKDPLPAPGAIIMSTHITSARARMNEALQSLGVIVNPYTPAQVKGLIIQGDHLNEIMGRAY